MSHAQHLVSPYGLPTHQFPGPGTLAGDAPAPDGITGRVPTGIDDADVDWAVAFTRFRTAVDTVRVRAQSPAPRALSPGGMVPEERGISWTNQTGSAQPLRTFSEPKELGVRGAGDRALPDRLELTPAAVELDLDGDDTEEEADDSGTVRRYAAVSG